MTGFGTRLCSVLLSIGMLVASASVAAAGPTFVYSINQVNGAPNQIYGFRLDRVTGALTLLSGFPMPSGGNGGAGSFSEHMTFGDGRLYVINEGSNSLSVFNVNSSSGALTAMPFSPIALSAGDPACVTVHPAGSPVVVGGSAGVQSFVITSTTATSAGAPSSTGGASPFSCGFSRDGNSVYTGGNVGSVIAGFSVTQSTGALAALAGSPFNSLGNNPVGYATDEAGRLFVSNFGTGVRAFTTSGGVPAAVSGNPFVSGLSGGVHGLVSPLGFYMVADRGANRVGVYQIAGSGAGTTLTAVSGSPFTTGGSFSDAISLTRDGLFLVAANGISRNLTVFRVNATSGVLTSASVQPVNTAGAAGLLTGLSVVSDSTSESDFDGEAKVDFTVFRPSTGTWFVLNSASNYGTFSTHTFGAASDKVVPGDYDADGKIDPSVYTPSTGTWKILKSSTTYTTTLTMAWGNTTDKPVPADYDGDGQTDIAIYRPSTGQWFVLLSTTNYTTFTIVSWGTATDIPLADDFDGDGRADIVVYRPSSGVWFILKSIGNYVNFSTVTWGVSTDIAVPGDYDGDGKADPAVYRPSTGQWFLLKSSTNYTTFASPSWGTGADIPVPGEYDGDGKTDPAIFRPSTGQWFVLKSNANYSTFLTQTWGVSTDTPILKRPQ